MERNMVMKKRKMDEEKLEQFLHGHRIATLAVNGDEGWPYAVPVHYLYHQGYLYFHSAKFGYKMDAIARDGRVCLTIIGDTQVLKEKFTATFESAVVEGRAQLVEDDAERLEVLKAMIESWCGTFDAAGQDMIDRTIGRTAVVRVEVERKTGKAYLG